MENSYFKPQQMEIAQTFQSYPSRRRKVWFQTPLLTVMINYYYRKSYIIIIIIIIIII